MLNPLQDKFRYDESKTAMLEAVEIYIAMGTRESDPVKKAGYQSRTVKLVERLELLEPLLRQGAIPDGKPEHAYDVAVSYEQLDDTAEPVYGEEIYRSDPVYGEESAHFVAPALPPPRKVPTYDVPKKLDDSFDLEAFRFARNVLGAIGKQFSFKDHRFSLKSSDMGKGQHVPLKVCPRSQAMLIC